MLRRFLTLLVCLGATFASAQTTTTPNLALNTPAQGTLNWGSLLNSNFTTIDTILGGGPITLKIPSGSAGAFNVQATSGIWAQGFATTDNSATTAFQAGAACTSGSCSSQPYLAFGKNANVATSAGWTSDSLGDFIVQSNGPSSRGGLGVPSVVALTAGVNNLLGYVSGDGNLHFAQPSLGDSYVFTGLTGGSFTNGNCVKINKQGSTVMLADQGVSCPLVTSFTTTAATTDNVTVTGMTASGHCFLEPTNSGAAGGIASVFVSNKTTNQITVTHTATSGWTFDVLCTAN